MHLLVRETHTLDEEDRATDLGQTPADIVFLSFSDSDLGAAASAWQVMGDGRPSLRLANLSRLRHPMSVDVYLESVVSHASAVIVRLLGGVAYWRYGVEELHELCKRRGIALAVLQGDGRADPALDALCTVSEDFRGRLDAMLGQAGPENLRRALLLAASAGGLRPDAGEQAAEFPLCGVYDFGLAQSGPVAAIVFYRSTLLAGDTAPLKALAAALAERGLRARGIFVASLKEPQSAALVRKTLADWSPAVVLSVTAFSAIGADGSPLDAADAPVIQLVLSGSSHAAWQAASRGVSQADFAMQIVLPECDGRLPGPVISFKAADVEIPGLEFALPRHVPHPPGIAMAAGRAAGWARLAGTPRPDRRVLIVLSDYPGAPGQIGHAVGLDALASVDAILALLHAKGYRVGRISVAPSTMLCDNKDGGWRSTYPPYMLHSYRTLFATLPQSLQSKITAAWFFCFVDKMGHVNF